MQNRIQPKKISDYSFFIFLRSKMTVKAFFAFTLMTVVFLLPIFVMAQSGVDFGTNYGVDTGLSTQDIRETIAKIIRYALGILGLIAVLIIIYGGYVWMTAGGNTQKIDMAKKYY